MVTSKTQRLLEQGYGYWCCEIPLVDEHPAVPDCDVDIASSEAADYNTQLVYRPVVVEEGDEEGTVVAWYYSTEEDPMGPTNGRRYVLTQQVYTRPLRGAEPAYKYDSTVMK